MESAGLSSGVYGWIMESTLLEKQGFVGWLRKLLLQKLCPNLFGTTHIVNRLI